MKTTLILFRETFFDAGQPKFEAGNYYPVSDETERFVPRIADKIEVDLTVEKAKKLAEKAAAALLRAAQAAADAEALALAAQEAQRLADEAEAALTIEQGSASPAGDTPPPADEQLGA